MERIRKHIELGYKTYTGKTFHRQIWVDNYNYIQGRINRFVLDGRPVPEYLLNESHQYFVSIASL